MCHLLALPRSLLRAQAEAIAAGDVHAAIELTVDGDLATHGAMLVVADPRVRSTCDEPHPAATDDCWASASLLAAFRKKCWIVFLRLLTLRTDLFHPSLFFSSCITPRLPFCQFVSPTCSFLCVFFERAHRISHPFRFCSPLPSNCTPFFLILLDTPSTSLPSD